MPKEKQRSKQARSLKERAKKFMPLGLQSQIYKIVKRTRLLKNIYSKKNISKQELKKIFVNAGLKKGDVVLAHSSMGRIGYIENGPDDVIDALLEIIGEDGLLVMPGFCDPKYYKEQKAYIFDVKNTPTYTGAIPEAFRKRKGVKRSISPTHSLCALGKGADEFIKNHENCDNPFAMNGPFGRLYHKNAKMLLIGVDHLANSSLHIVEDMPDFPVKVFTSRFRAIVYNNGNKKIIEARRHTAHSRKIRDPNIMEKYCLEYKVMKIFKIGNAEMRVIQIKPFVDMMKELYKKGITIY